MKTILKKALIPTIIIEVILLILCRITTEFDEFTTTILVFGSPLWLFTALFAVFAYKDIKETITELHSSDEDDTEH